MADIRKKIDELNEVYSRLREKAVRIVGAFKKLEADVSWGWYAGHNVDVRGSFVYEAFPIPVITVKDICEIGVDLKGAYIEGRIFSAEADAFDFDRLAGYDFCVYGSDSYLSELYDSRKSGEDELDELMFSLDETDSELCIDLIFPAMPTINVIIEACSLLMELGTHILPVDAGELGDCYTAENEELFN